MGAKEVELKMYNKMEYVGYTCIPYEGVSIHKYVEICNDISEDEEFEYDMIKVDDRFVITVIAPNVVFMSGISMNYSHILFVGNEAINISDMYKEEKEQTDLEEKIMDDVENIMRYNCDYCDNSIFVTDIVFKRKKPTCPNCGNIINL